MSLTKRWT